MPNACALALILGHGRGDSTAGLDLASVSPLITRDVSALFPEDGLDPWTLSSASPARKPIVVAMHGA